jgi:predicted DNA-binding protein (MmcQ/YjbR family)
VDESDLEERVRRICVSLPEVTERMSHGSPAFFVTKQFVMLWANGHRDHDFAHLWCAAAPGIQGDLIDQSTERAYRPPYVSARSWIGVRLDGDVDFDEIEMFCEDAYRFVATKRQVALLDGSKS